MLGFDYISGEELRSSLKSDYAELERSNAAGNWKSVHVLAGSIVEALLVDTLLSLPGWSGKDPLTMALAEVIAGCKQEKIISERAADLCSVLRSYRNLIHPGRLVRLNEARPDDASAAVALALVRMIVDEVAKKRRSVVGLTADQVISKIMRDGNANSILKHLLVEVSDSQKRRLLLDLIPAEHERTFEDSFEDQSRLETAFRIVLDSCGDEIKKDVAAAAVSVIREADGDRVERYIMAFFVAVDLEFVAEKDRPMVIDHLLSVGDQDGRMLSERKIKVWSGLSAYLTATSVTRWANEYLRCIVYARDKTLRRHATNAFTWEACELKADTYSLLEKRLGSWKNSLSNKEDLARVVDELKQEIQSVRDLVF